MVKTEYVVVNKSIRGAWSLTIVLKQRFIISQNRLKNLTFYKREKTT